MRPSGIRRPRQSPRRGIFPSFDALDKDFDLAAAGETDFPGLFITDSEIEKPRLAVVDCGLRLFDDRALDAAARYRADELAGLADRELGPRRARRRAPSLDHGRQRNALAGAAPRRRLFEDFRVIAHLLLLQAARAPIRKSAAALNRGDDGELNTVTKFSRLSRLCTGRNSSTCGNIALIPNDFGSNPS